MGVFLYGYLADVHILKSNGKNNGKDRISDTINLGLSETEDPFCIVCISIEYQDHYS